MNTPLVSEEQYRLLTAGTLLVVDVECTCGPGITTDIQDIVQMGFVPVVLGLPVVPEHASSVNVRPQRSQITGFCTRLTGITSADVATASVYQELAPRLAELHDKLAPDAWVSWGPDHNLVQQQNEAFDSLGPFHGIPHTDIRRLLTPLIYQLTGLQRPKGSSAGVGLKAALTALGLEFIGVHHNAGADALNAARVLHEVRRRLADYADRIGNADPEAVPSVDGSRRKPTLH